MFRRVPMIERPRCPKCQVCMMLIGIKPSIAGPDLRTFECPKCKLAYKTLAESVNAPSEDRA
jgi:hypothetical protein